jgi:Family of unknown function (DUF6636)
VGRLVLLLGLVLVLAACGGNEATTVTVTGASRTETTALTVTVEPLPTITTSQPALRSRTFQMPSKNIGCATSEGVLVCDVLSGLKPEPKRKCEVDWTGMEMERLGPAQPRCAGDTAYDQSAPVLEYGTSWSRDGFTCASQENGVQCLNQEKHGFLLSRETWTQF